LPKGVALLQGVPDRYKYKFSVKIIGDMENEGKGRYYERPSSLLLRNRN